MPRTRNGAPEVAAKKRPPSKRPPTKRTPPKGKGEQKPEKPETRMSVFEAVRLAERVATARYKTNPDTWAAIAKREEKPERTLRHLLARYEDDMRRLGDGTGGPILTETLLLYTHAIEKLAWEAEHGETAAARVGALRSMLDAMKGRIELLAVMGRMPRSFRAMDELAALQRLVRRIAEIVERHQFPAEVVQEFVAMADEVQPIIEGTAIPALPRAS